MVITECDCLISSHVLRQPGLQTLDVSVSNCKLCLTWCTAAFLILRCFLFLPYGVYAPLFFVFLSVNLLHLQRSICSSYAKYSGNFTPSIWLPVLFLSITARFMLVGCWVLVLLLSIFSNLLIFSFFGKASAQILVKALEPLSAALFHAAL